MTVPKIIVVVNWINEHKTHLLLLLIVILGFKLRSYQTIEKTNFLFADAARDILVAKHIAEYNAPIVKPFVGVGNKILENSPLYFLLLSSVWRLFPRPLGLIYIFIILGTLQIVVNFKIGKFLQNEMLGLALALTTATGHIFVKSSQSILQTRIIPVFISLIVFYGLKTNRLNRRSTANNARQQARFLSLSILFFFIALHFHYSLFFLLPVLFFYALYAAYNIGRNQLQAIAMPLISGLLLGLTWMISTNNLFFIPKMIANISSTNTVFKPSSLPQNFNRNLEILSGSLFPKLGDKASIITVLFLFSMVSLLIAKNKHRRDQLFLFLLSMSIGFASFFNDRIVMYSYRLMPFYTILLITVFNAVYIIFSKSKIIIISIFTLFLIALNKNIFSPQPAQVGSLKESYRIAQLILNDYAKSVGENKINIKKDLIVYVVDHITGKDWFSSALYYPIEELSGIQLSQVVNLNQSYKNANWTNKKGRFIYVLCEKNELSQNNTKYCYDFIATKHPKAISESINKINVRYWGSMREIFLIKFIQLDS